MGAAERFSFAASKRGRKRVNHQGLVRKDEATVVGTECEHGAAAETEQTAKKQQTVPADERRCQT